MCGNNCVYDSDASMYTKASAKYELMAGNAVDNLLKEAYHGRKDPQMMYLNQDLDVLKGAYARAAAETSYHMAAWSQMKHNAGSN